MDISDIPAAAALLCAGLSSSGAQVAQSETRVAPAQSTTSSSNLLDISAVSSRPATSSAAMESDAATAATSYVAQAYPQSAGLLTPNTALMQNYYAQFANVAGYGMPMYGFGMLPSLSLAAAQGAFIGATMAPQTAYGAPLAQPYDRNAQALTSQMMHEFSRYPPQEQTTYYENIRQQLHDAAAGLTAEQKQALLLNDPSLSFSMKPLDLDKRESMEDASSSTGCTPRGLKKRARAESAAGGAVKKPRKSKMTPVSDPSSGERGLETILLSEDSGMASSSSTPPPKPAQRGRPPSAGRITAAAAAAAAGIELTPSGKKKSMTLQAQEMRARKAKMTWPKGTFILRLQDIKVRNGRDHIWLVDNHQLLQRYNNESGSVLPDGSRVYHKTDRYTGWLCNEGFHYYPLFEHQHILENDGTRVTVKFPDDMELQQAIDYEEQEKQRKVEEARDEEEGMKRGTGAISTGGGMTGKITTFVPKSMRGEDGKLIEKKRAEGEASTSAAAVAAAHASSSRSRSGTSMQQPQQPRALLQQPATTSRQVLREEREMPLLTPEESEWLEVMDEGEEGEEEEEEGMKKEEEEEEEEESEDDETYL